MYSPRKRIHSGILSTLSAPSKWKGSNHHSQEISITKAPHESRLSFSDEDLVEYNPAEFVEEEVYAPVRFPIQNTEGECRWFDLKDIQCD